MTPWTAFWMGCAVVGQQDPASGVPVLVVDPPQVDFGRVASGAFATREVGLENGGTASLEIQDLVLPETSAFSLESGAAPALVEPGGRWAIQVGYTPRSERDGDTLRVQSDDPGWPQVEVGLSGEGVFVPLALDPGVLDLGWVPVGATGSGLVWLQNETDQALTVSDVLVDGDPAFSTAFPVPSTLEPGSRASVPVLFVPTVDAQVHASLWVDGPDLEAPVVATLQATSLGPVASCWADPNPAWALYDLVTLRGDGSADLGGGTLVEWTWTLLARPEGSHATLPEGDANRPGFVADLAGTYQAALTVTNDGGLTSLPCTVDLEALPRQALWVELSWALPGDDLDLHLLRPGGTLWTSGDCHWQNCQERALDWGVTGDAVDDPSLDLDDVEGTGPENINIQAPEPGTFSIWVHDHPDSDVLQTNPAMVRVWLDGVLAWSGTVDLEGEDRFLAIADVDVATSTVTPR